MRYISIKSKMVLLVMCLGFFLIPSIPTTSAGTTNSGWINVYDGFHTREFFAEVRITVNYDSIFPPPTYQEYKKPTSVTFEVRDVNLEESDTFWYDPPFPGHEILSIIHFKGDTGTCGSTSLQTIWGPEGQSSPYYWHNNWGMSPKQIAVSCNYDTGYTFWGTDLVFEYWEVYWPDGVLFSSSTSIRGPYLMSTYYNGFNI